MRGRPEDGTPDTEHRVDLQLSPDGTPLEHHFPTRDDDLAEIPNLTVFQREQGLQVSYDEIRARANTGFSGIEDELEGARHEPQRT